MAAEFERIVDNRKMAFSAGTRRLVEGVQRSYIPVRYVPDIVLAQIYAVTIMDEEFKPTERITVGVVAERDRNVMRKYWTRLFRL